MKSSRDKLILLNNKFTDPALPGQDFYCWHCVMLEGVLATFPEIAAQIDIERVDFPRPRESVIAQVGEENQSLPVLILAEGTHTKHRTGVHLGKEFVSDKFAILTVLSERFGIPLPHP